MHIIGLTGGICCGKSTVAKILSSCNPVIGVIPIINADLLGHAAYRKDSNERSCYSRLISHFGSEILREDGEINRSALGSIVFGSKDKLNELTSIVWPEIRKLIESDFGRYKSEGHPQVILEAAVLLEAGWTDLVSSIWIVTAPTDIVERRLMQRNGFTLEEARKRINAQMTNEERLSHANVIINNPFTDDEGPPQQPESSLDTSNNNGNNALTTVSLQKLEKEVKLAYDRFFFP